MRIGIVKCEETLDYCPSTGCFLAAKKKTGKFRDYEDIEIIGLTTCGGCPGRKIVERVKKMKQKGVEVVHLSTCMVQLHPEPPKCPFIEEIKKALKERVDIKVVEGTHNGRYSFNH
jgi:predicted metal-binding protein